MKHSQSRALAKVVPLASLGFFSFFQDLVMSADLKLGSS